MLKACLGPFQPFKGKNKFQGSGNVYGSDIQHFFIWKPVRFDSLIKLNTYVIFNYI